MIVTPRNEYRIGDSLKLMPELVADESVDLILTDPPFGWNYRSNRARTEAGKVRNQRLINDHTLGWQPTCSCSAGEPVPCTVLDPFSGSATTLFVAEELGRDSIGIDLNESYRTLAEHRLARANKTIGMHLD